MLCCKFVHRICRSNHMLSNKDSSMIFQILHSPQHNFRFFLLEVKLKHILAKFSR
uniref:Uncharacterized protein n=1 Tax=Rhizophora mucronata TaxID=61149 RepID=A0A2P2M8H8_RHIMU